MISFKHFLQINETFKSLLKSLKILHIISGSRRLKLEKEIKDLFPIDHTDYNYLHEINIIIFNLTNIDTSIYMVNEHELFSANEDYALTILNRYFTVSPLVRFNMWNFLHSKLNFITENNIESLYNQFHSKFGIKSINN